MSAKQPTFGPVMREFFRVSFTAMQQELKATALTLQQSGILMAVSQQPGATSAELARGRMVTPQAMSEVIASVERAGLLQKRPHPGSARMQGLHLTEKGDKAVANIKKAHERVERRLLAALSPADRKKLTAMLLACIDEVKRTIV